MGILNHLFGGRKGLAKELIDKEKRIEILKKHPNLYLQKSEKAKYFSFKNIDDALKNFNGLLEVLQEIEGMTKKELIDIEGETKNGEVIILDLKKLSSTQSNDETVSLLTNMGEGVDLQKNVLKLLQKLYDVLSTELHAIKHIEKKIEKKELENLKDLLLDLFKLIFHQEAYLWKAFMNDSFLDKDIPLKIDKIARAILFEEELKEEVITLEEKFVRSTHNIMQDDSSEHHYRKLAENIFSDLIEEAANKLYGAFPFSSNKKAEKGLKEVENMVNNDALLFRIIKKNRPRYDDKKLKLVMEAFRRAYGQTDFTGSVDLYT